ncbi:MAG: hypothetical protein JF587_06690 [Catenulisporales bacterium]|nr:hypothetical protein [Catenulisporales bacterium]
MAKQSSNDNTAEAIIADAAKYLADALPAEDAAALTKELEDGDIGAAVARIKAHSEQPNT